MITLTAVWSPLLREAIIEGMEEDSVYPMRLIPADGRIVEKAVNQGIDSRLEACNVPDRGDRYEWRSYMNGSPPRLVCEVSAESLCVLVRRLLEMDPDEQHEADIEEDRAFNLAEGICATLGIELV